MGWRGAQGGLKNVGMKADVAGLKARSTGTGRIEQLLTFAFCLLTIDLPFPWVGKWRS